MWLHEPGERQRFSDVAGSIVVQLCEVLTCLADHEPSLQHLDFTPANVVIHGDNPAVPQVYVIHFGRNFLFTQRTGPPTAYRRGELFVADEIKTMIPNRTPPVTPIRSA